MSLFTRTKTTDMHNLFLFLGKDSFSAYRTLQRWREEFEKKYGDYNFQLFEGEDLTIDEYRNAVNTLPFASEKKLVVIRDYLDSAGNDDQQKMAEELSSLPEHCILVFMEREKPDGRTMLYKKLTQLGQVKDFPELEGPALAQWIINEMNKKIDQARDGTPPGVTNPIGLKETGPIGLREAGHLAEAVGPNLWQMSQELEKIYLYSRGKRGVTPGKSGITTDKSGITPANNTPSGNTVSAAEIEQLISPNLSASIFKLTDSIAARNPKTALKILSTLLESGEDIFQTFYMIARQFRILLQIKSCLEQKMNQQKIISKMKEKPFTVTNGISQCKNFTQHQLADGYRNLLSIDIALKTGKIRTTTDDAGEFRLALEKLILTLSKC